MFSSIPRFSPFNYKFKCKTRKIPVHYENMTLKITLKVRVSLKIERTKDMSNTDNFQWDYKGLTFLDNNSGHILV